MTKKFTIVCKQVFAVLILMIASQAAAQTNEFRSLWVDAWWN
jgi:hypothetical protein